jgi:hypothetical protein
MADFFKLPVLAAGVALSLGIAAPALACEGCFSPRTDLSFSIGTNHRGSSEAYIRYEGPSTLGALRPVAGVSVSRASEVWAGAGLMLTWKQAGGPFFLQGSVMPGLYSKGNGRDLGGSLQFRSSLEAGYEFPSDLRVSIGIDHRSNADLNSFNPGMDGLHLRLTMPVR